jgi:protein-S-isoprenylcysteine O-methyltransferase Ste14
VILIVMRAERTRTALVKLLLTYVGKIIGLLGAVAVIGAFWALASNDPVNHRLLRFVWVLIVGVSLLAAGIWLMRWSKRT